jgi:hypothetical protein
MLAYLLGFFNENIAGPPFPDGKNVSKDQVFFWGAKRELLITQAKLAKF